MAFKKGQSGNPDGRPKGSENKVNKDLKEKIKRLFENYTGEQMLEDLLELDAKDRLMIMGKLADFIAPRLKSTEFKGTVNKEIYELIHTDEPKV
jgi:hypothetical protein